MEKSWRDDHGSILTAKAIFGKICTQAKEELKKEDLPVDRICDRLGLNLEDVRLFLSSKDAEKSPIQRYLTYDAAAFLCYVEGITIGEMNINDREKIEEEAANFKKTKKSILEDHAELLEKLGISSKGQIITACHYTRIYTNSGVKNIFYPSVAKDCANTVRNILYYTAGFYEGLRKRMSPHDNADIFSLTKKNNAITVRGQETTIKLLYSKLGKPFVDWERYVSQEEDMEGVSDPLFITAILYYLKGVSGNDFFNQDKNVTRTELKERLLAAFFIVKDEEKLIIPEIEVYQTVLMLNKKWHLTFAIENFYFSEDTKKWLEMIIKREGELSKNDVTRLIQEVFYIAGCYKFLDIDLYNNRATTVEATVATTQSKTFVKPPAQTAQTAHRSRPLPVNPTIDMQISYKNLVIDALVKRSDCAFVISMLHDLLEKGNETVSILYLLRCLANSK